MDLVDEEDVAIFEGGELGGEIAGLGDDRPGSRAEIDAEFARDDLRQSGLPRPGGPQNRTWSSASRRALAASMKTLRLARAAAWPVKSARLSGRSDESASSSRDFGRHETAGTNGQGQRPPDHDDFGSVNPKS